MIKKLCTLLILATLSAPLLAQTVGSSSDGVLFAPKKGQWQVSVLLGGGNNFYNEKPPTCFPKTLIPEEKSDFPTVAVPIRAT